jgi:hypothetical protein
LIQLPSQGVQTLSRRRHRQQQRQANRQRARGPLQNYCVGQKTSFHGTDLLVS